VKLIIDDLALLQGDRQTFLLEHTDVLDDLNLSAEQRAKVKNLQKYIDECRGEPFREFHRQTAEETRQRLLSQAREHETEIAAILSSQQQRRLRQIALQTQGPGAFRDTDIVKRLWLTDEQRAQIRIIEEESSFGGPPPRDPRAKDFHKAMTGRLKATTERILKVLSKEQLQLWQRMTGEPYTGEYPPPFGPKGPRH
jgi:eukaryotic-like serine/threonine-protein kinase